MPYEAYISRTYRDIARPSDSIEDCIERCPVQLRMKVNATIPFTPTFVHESGPWFSSGKLLRSRASRQQRQTRNARILHQTPPP